MPRTKTCEALLVDLSTVLAQIEEGGDQPHRAESVEMSYAHKAIREARMWIVEHVKMNGDVTQQQYVTFGPRAQWPPAMAGMTAQDFRDWVRAEETRKISRLEEIPAGPAERPGPGLSEDTDRIVES